MTNRSRVFVDLVVVSAFVGLVAEEVDLLEAFWLDVSKRVGFVPSMRAAEREEHADVAVSMSCRIGRRESARSYKASNEICPPIAKVNS